MLETLNPFKKSLRRRFAVSDIEPKEPVILDIAIYYSDKPLAPDDPTDASIQRIHSFPYLLNVRPEDFPINSSPINGKEYRQVNYKVGIDTEDAQVHFSL